MSVSETPTGVLSVRWDITQSRLPIIRPDLTVNGHLEIWPNLQAGGNAELDYFGEGFPSEEAYYYWASGTRTTLFRHREGSFLEMAEWRGNWHTSQKLPREVWRTRYA